MCNFLMRNCSHTYRLPHSSESHWGTSAQLWTFGIGQYFSVVEEVFRSFALCYFIQLLYLKSVHSALSSPWSISSCEMTINWNLTKLTSQAEIRALTYVVGLLSLVRNTSLTHGCRHSLDELKSKNCSDLNHLFSLTAFLVWYLFSS